MSKNDGGREEMENKNIKEIEVLSGELESLYK